MMSGPGLFLTGVLALTLWAAWLQVGGRQWGKQIWARASPQGQSMGCQPPGFHMLTLSLLCLCSASALPLLCLCSASAVSLSLRVSHGGLLAVSAASEL